MKRNENSLRDLWENISTIILHYRGPRRRRQRGPEKII